MYIWFNIQNINEYNSSHGQKIKEKTMIISIDGKKAFANIQYPFMIKQNKRKSRTHEMKEAS